MPVTKVFNFPYEGTPKWYQDLWQEEVEAMVGRKNSLTPEEKEVYFEIVEHFKTRHKRSPKCYKTSAYRDITDITALTANDIYEFMRFNMDTFIQYHAMVKYQEEWAYVVDKK